MKNSVIKKFSILILSLVFSVSVMADTTKSKFERDALTIDGIISAYYSLVSGPKGFKYNPTMDTFLNAPNAIITRFKANGDFQRHTLLVEQKALEEPYVEGFYEIEIHRTEQRYANIAHVWSTYEVRPTPDGKASQRGINSISLYLKDGRWWIASWNAQTESANNLPPEYLPESGLRSEAGVE